MKMILNSIGKTSGNGVRVGKIYECIGASFTDDNGKNRLVSDFGWMSLDESSSNFADYISEDSKTFPIKDDDRQEPNVEVKASETQIGGTHYTSMGLQPLEATYRIFGYVGLKAAIFTKVVKYINRNKDNEVEQLKKARHCLDLLIEKAELENENNS